MKGSLKVNKSFVRTAAIFLLASSLLLPTSCSQQQGGPSSTSTQPQSDRWLGVLHAMPVNDTTVVTTYVQDYARLAEEQKQFPNLAGTPVPGAPVGYPIMQNNRFWDMSNYDDAEWQKDMGFTMSDMDQEAFGPLVPPSQQYEVLRGRFSQNTIDSALKADPTNGDLTIVTYAGVNFYSAGKDGINLNRRSDIDPAGQALRLAVVDDYVLSSSFTKSMEEMIDAYQGNVQSLADQESYQLLADGLSKLDAFAAIFSSASQAQSAMQEKFKSIIQNPGNTPQDIPRRTMADQLQRKVFLKPYDAVATGAGLDKKGYYLAIVLVNPDEQTARDNAAALKEQINASQMVTTGKPWSDLIQTMDIESQGRLTLAKLYGDAWHYWMGFDLESGRYDPLLMYQG